MEIIIIFKVICVLCLSSFVVCGEMDESEGGSFLFLSANEELSEDNSHLVAKGKDAKLDCQEEKLLAFLFSLQIINPESVIALATKHKLEKMCTNISKNIDHMQSYLKKCNLHPNQQTYKQLLNGVVTLHKKLCTHDPYHKTFLEFKNCYSQLQTEFDSCNGPADWTDNSDNVKVCKAYEDIADCYYIKTSVLCGNKAADIFKELVNAVIDSVVTVNCKNNITCGNLNKPSAEKLSQHQQISASNNLKSIHLLNLVFAIFLFV